MAQGFAGVPPGPLSAYLGVREANRAGGLQELQQAGAVQGLLARMHEEQEINQLKGVVQQAGGNPEKAIQALIAAGTPKSLALAAQLKGLVPKPAEPFTLAPGAQRRGPGGELLASAPFKPEAPKPFGNVHNVPGGYIEEYELGKRRFVRTEREPAVPVSERVVQDKSSPTGWSYEDARTLKRRVGAPPPAASARVEERTEQRVAAADYATLLTDRLNTLLAENPRSATGIFAPVVRATEAVVNAVAPGAIGSQATISSQTKEQLITVLSQLRGGAMGRLSNQDMRRVDTAIGQINSGTPEGMAQGLSDTYDLIDTLQGKPARSGKGITRGIGRPGVPSPPPGFKLDQ